MSDLLQVRNISKQYDGVQVLRDMSFNVAAGEIVCLLGPSGTGKTTLLRIIAGLEEANAGRVVFDGKDSTAIPPHARGLGMMFQDLALFPHKNVFDNIAFGLRMNNTPANEIKPRVEETLALVGLDAARFAARDVNRLSGGEQQRVGLARTLAPRPRLIMFDEPLGALDRILRQELVNELRALLKRMHLTALYVTHDQEEAFAIADKLILLNAGRIEQIGTPLEIYQHPSNVFVARFMGLTNLIEIRDSPDYGLEQVGIEIPNVRVGTGEGFFEIARERIVGESARFVLLRPRAVERIVEQSERAENVLRGKIVESHWRGGHQRILLQARTGAFTFEWDGEVIPNQECMLELNPTQIDLLNGATKEG